jgi:hypothetical protein
LFETRPWQSWISVDVEIILQTPIEMKPASTSDHRSIVRIEARTRNGNPRESAQALFSKARQSPAASDTATNDNRSTAGSSDGSLQLGREHVEHSSLERCGKVRTIRCEVP